MYNLNKEEKNTLQSIHHLQAENLYEILVKQIIKDFQLVNVSISIENETSPEDLVKELYQTIHHLLIHDYTNYLNLLYRIDVSEKELKNSSSSDSIDSFCKHICLLILKKEIQKIYFRKKYK
ncbi:hypothetical protein [Aureivirga sp. CE67]|uniref:hypothetical protein n=1 Tax=Aureivirga sp. CE67 TaxID=1788983 RepID=UPI0018CB7906|nr:hypothetical protein [Aureivirga sp. CE67]